MNTVHSFILCMNKLPDDLHISIITLFAQCRALKITAVFTVLAANNIWQTIPK